MAGKTFLSVASAAFLSGSNVRQVDGKSRRMCSTKTGQIIDKALYVAVADEIAGEVATYTPDEWSPYFTLGAGSRADQ